MKITKLSEEITYILNGPTLPFQKISKEYVFKVNGKKVRVSCCYNEQDSEYPINDEYGQDINEKDLEKLTDLEQEAIGENLGELLDLKEGVVFRTAKAPI